MCGRFTRQFTWRRLHELMNLRHPAPQDANPRWNVAPTQTGPVCRLDPRGEREVVMMRWGFTPRWSREPAPGPLHARSETVATNGMFRAAYASSRCLIPVTGFYEWRTQGGPRRPYLLTLPGTDTFCFAGIWERWSRAEQSVESFAILTTSPNELVATIHDRMPVIVRPEHYHPWLSCAPPAPGFFEPYPAAAMEMLEASPADESPRRPRRDHRSDPGPSLFEALA